MAGLLGFIEGRIGFDLEGQVKADCLAGCPYRMESVYSALVMGYGVVAVAATGAAFFETVEVEAKSPVVEAAINFFINRAVPGSAAVAAGTVAVEALVRRRRAGRLRAAYAES